MILLQEMFKKHPHNQYFLVRGACSYHEKVRILDYKGVRTGVLCGFELYRTAIFYYITKDDTTELMVILNLIMFNLLTLGKVQASLSLLSLNRKFQDQSAEKDK